VPVTVQGITDINTNLINIQRSLSGLISSITSVSIATNFTISAAPFLNSGTIGALGTITAATLTATGLLGGQVGTIAGVVAIGSGLNLSVGNVLTSTIGGGTVTQINTTGPGISGGPITSTGALAVQWNAGIVNTLGTTLALSAGTLDVVQVIGVATNSSAPAGIVGEYISSTVLVGSAVALSTGTPANVTSISLTAGDWDVWGSVAFNPAGTTTITAESGGINTVTGTLPTSPGGGGFVSLAGGFTTGAGDTLPVGSTRLSLPATTTVYLVAQAAFAISTMGAYGFLGARRRR
jgi:hypothetical protein